MTSIRPRRCTPLTRDMQRSGAVPDPSEGRRHEPAGVETPRPSCTPVAAAACKAAVIGLLAAALGVAVAELVGGVVAVGRLPRRRGRRLRDRQRPARGQGPRHRVVRHERQGGPHRGNPDRARAPRRRVWGCSHPGGPALAAGRGGGAWRWLGVLRHPRPDAGDPPPAILAVPTSAVGAPRGGAHPRRPRLRRGAVRPAGRRTGAGRRSTERPRALARHAGPAALPARLGIDRRPRRRDRGRRTVPADPQRRRGRPRGLVLPRPKKALPPISRSVALGPGRGLAVHHPQPPTSTGSTSTSSCRRSRPTATS